MIGRHLSHYEIVEAIGAGGMGEVYRARDTKLGRDVAIKVLPKEFSRDKDRLARFEREARLLAQLNHANIATLHGLETFEGQRFLVMELVEGETLAERIERGAIPIAEALPIFRQIAEGLEAAHEKGIIHRDLKPANIKITPDGKVKILDFGLAKAFSSEDDVSTATSSSPTLTKGTALGAILGTAPYMSPEQARGNTVDRRTDVWAFGCCLYEALTGKATFRGNTVSDTIANVLKQEPEWDKLPESIPTKIRALLRRCLQKDGNRRLRDIWGARLEIEEAIAAPDDSAVERRPPTPARSWAVGVGSFLLGAAVIGLTLRPGADPEPKPVTRLVVSIDSPMAGVIGWPFDLAPDGRTLVYVSEQAGSSQLYRREMHSLDHQPLPGTDGASQPFFSPDGMWVGFVADGLVRKVPISGGPPVTICDAPARLTNAFWASDDSIIMSTFELGLLQVSADGGVPQTIAKLRFERGEIGYTQATLLPGNRAVVFTTAYGSPFDTTIDLLLPATGERRTLMPGLRAFYIGETRHLVVSQADRTAVAVPFDVERLEITGEPVQVLEGIRMSPSGFPLLDVSHNGSLLYVAGEIHSVMNQLQWLDRNGRVVPFGVDAQGYIAPTFSPDGRELALHIMAPEGRDIWVYDVATVTPRRLTFDPAPDAMPLWSPDGQRIVFESLREGVGLFWKASDGSGPAHRITTSQKRQMPYGWTSDGKTLVFGELDPETGWNIRALSWDEPTSTTTLIETPAHEVNATLSPDGQWLAYQSNESGRDEIYVQDYPDLSGKWQVSSGGGQWPMWDPAGAELYYRQDQQMMSVAVGRNEGLSPGGPRELFQTRGLSWYGGMGAATSSAGRNYAVAPDGERFLVIQDEFSANEQARTGELTIVLNWYQELKQLAPSGN